MTRSFIPILGGCAAALLLAGCVLRPDGARNEAARADEAGRGYQLPVEQRQLPELPAQPTWQEVLHRAFLANGDLEAAFFAWRGAVHRIDRESTWPMGNLSLEFEYAFSSERMKSFDRTKIELRQEAPLPMKTAKAGQMALSDAQAAGERFLAMKFEVQRKVLIAWADYALLAEKLRITRDNVALLRVLAETAGNRVRAGAAQQDLLKAQIELQMAENDLKNMEAELPQKRAMLNAMLGRKPGEALEAPAAMPAPRPVKADDAALLAAGVTRNAELAALARETQGRERALELARMQYIPDFAPFGGFRGSMEQWLGAMVSIPTALPAIRASIQEARTDLARMQAMRRQTALDREAAFVAALHAMRNSERQIELFEKTILPTAQLVLENSRQSYSAGAVGFIELIDSQRTLLEVRLMIAESRAARERALAELEAVGGFDADK